MGAPDVPAPTPLDTGAVGLAPPLGDCPLPLLKPVGLDPLLELVLPLPSLNPVGFDPLLDPVAPCAPAVSGLASLAPLLGAVALP